MSGLSRPTVHRLLRVLIEETAVEQDPATRRYLVGPELSLLGLARTGAFSAARDRRALSAGAGRRGRRHRVPEHASRRRLGVHRAAISAITRSRCCSINLGVRSPLGASVSGIVLLAALRAGHAPSNRREPTRRASRCSSAASTTCCAWCVPRARRPCVRPHGVMPGSAALAVPVERHRTVTCSERSASRPWRDRLERKRVPAVLEHMQRQARLITRRHAEVQAARARVRRRDERT